MIMREVFTSLNLTILFQKEFAAQIIHYSAIFLLNLASYLYIFIKFYKVLCYCKMTFDWLPMINPYRWPFSLIQGLTTPYFSFWSNVFPNLRFQNSSLEISGIVSLEALNSLLYFSVRMVQFLIVILEEQEANLMGDN